MVKPILKEANYSDDDVWEPSLRKEKAPVPAPKTSRHSTSKKVSTFYISIIFLFSNKCFVLGENKRKIQIIGGYWGASSQKENYFLYRFG